MSVLERKIIHGGASSFSHILYPQFVLPRHKHLEYEIMIVTQGSGKQFVGDGVADYGQWDMALIGSNVPHQHLCNATLSGHGVTPLPDKTVRQGALEDVVAKGSGPILPCGDDVCVCAGGYSADTGIHVPSAGEVLQFPPSLFPEGMDSITDYRAVGDLLRRSRRGVRFHDRGLAAEVYCMIQWLDGVSGTQRLIRLMAILDKLSRTDRYSFISGVEYNERNAVQDMNDPVSRVYTYLFNHFRDAVALGDVAAFAGQNPSALCRLFRRRTDKSIFECLAEIRIGHACKLLAYSGLSVSQVAYESGFNQLSHFNRQFQRLMHCTPVVYRRQVQVR